MESRFAEWLVSSRSRTWILSAAVGAIGAPLFLLGGLLGAAIVAWLAIFLWYGRSRVVVASGMLSGFGALWLAMLVPMAGMARIVDPPFALAIGAISLAAGLGLYVIDENVRPAGKRHGRGHQMEREDTIGYFRDFGASGRGVQEEDRSGRWGSGSP